MFNSTRTLILIDIVLFSSLVDDSDNDSDGSLAAGRQIVPFCARILPHAEREAVGFA